MAENIDKEECCICLNEFKQPKILDCQHSFCQICLQDHVDTTSNNGEFQCPLCRRNVTLPEGGVKNFPCKPTNDVPRCEVCTTGEAGFKCRDCDQYLCRSCRRMHDSLKSCKNHVVVGWDEQVPHADKPDTKHVHDERDLCPCRRKKRVKYLCEDCNKLVCSKCCFSDHNGHKLKDLQDEGVKQQITDEISSLKDQIEHHINKLEEFGEGLKVKENEMATIVKELCDKIDIQVQNVCVEVTRTGENIKENVKKIYLHDEENASSGPSDTMKIKRLMEDNKTALEALKASLKTSSIVLEERSIVPMVQSLDQLRQEVKDCGSRKMVIPDVPVMEFVAGEIDRDILSKQVGRLYRDIFSKQVGRLVGRGGMFDVWFDVNDISKKGKEYDSREIECVGMPWRVGVCRYGDGRIVWIGLNLTKTPQGIESCKVDYCFKLVNIKDDRQSVVKHGIRTITQGRWLDGIYCKWRRLTDKQAGFIDDKKRFKIQVELKILDMHQKNDSVNVIKF